MPCPNNRNGRRLRKAWPWIQLRIKEFKQWAKDVTLEACEGSHEFWQLIQAMCKTCASELRLNFKHLGLVPWAFVQAESIEGAKECVRQVRAQPLENHDSVTRDFLRRVGNDLDARAEGGPLTDALAAAVAEIDDAMLDEGPGEGYHRGTNLEKQRAAASTTEHMKRSVRIKGVIRTCRKFMRTHGAAGREAFRYEWYHFQTVFTDEPQTQVAWEANVAEGI